MTAGSETTLRADARRNRDRIIAAARGIFAEQGPDVPMEEIARAAAVGVATLYRRFPDRDTLIREVSRANVESVLAETQAAIAEESTAWQALVRFMGQSVELRLSVRLAMLSPSTAKVVHEDPMIEEHRRALLGALDEIVRAAQREGALRTDVGTGDVAAMFSLLLWQLPSRYDEAALLIPQRGLALMLDGLRAWPAGHVLPGRALTKEDLGG